MTSSPRRRPQPARGASPKRFRPDRLIRRDAALAALDRVSDHAVTIVAAPAGSGKTSLLRCWARRSKKAGPVFVSVERDRHDAQLFWLSLLRAIRAASGTGAEAEAPLAAPDFDEASMVDQVLAGLSEFDHRVTLIIDDAHELTAQNTLRQLARLLTSLPEGVHVILATRGDLPLLRLHRLRLAGELAELGEADLRFTERETGELLSLSGVSLSPAGISLLHRRTEGWAAGIRLAAISLAGHPDPERFVAEFSGSDRAVAEYLIPEMLERQPEDVQRLLLRTSILDRVNGELADLLTGRPGSERTLLELEDANSFVVSLDPARTWFRYHHLTADFLRLELRRRMPAEVPGLHRTASAWFAEHGRIIDAVRHRQAACDWSEAARILSGHALGMMLDGQEESIHALLGAFPRQGADYPELNVAHAMVDLAHGRLDKTDAHVRLAEACLDSTPPENRQQLRMALTALKLSLARRRANLADVREHAEFLDRPVGAGSAQEILLDGDLRVLALLSLGTVEGFSMDPAGVRRLSDALDLARRINRPYLEMTCLAHLGFAHQFTSFTLARNYCTEAISVAESHGWGGSRSISGALLTLAFTQIWSGDLATSELLIERAAHALRFDDGPGMNTVYHWVKGMHHAGRRQLDAALEHFATAQQSQQRLASTHALAGFVEGWAAATRVRLGDPETARQQLNSLKGPLTETGEIVNAWAVIHLAEEDPHETLRKVAGVIDGSAPSLHIATVVEAHLIGALAHRRLGNRRAAHRAVESALTLAEPETLVMPFIMTGAHELLADLPLHETSHAPFINDILDAVHTSSPTERREYAPPLPKLSPTELRVLQYLPTNLPRREIASALSLSINTVGTHIRNIYAKLQATDRSSAVRRARELRLLRNGTTRF